MIVTDQGDRPIAGVAVTFAVASGGGTITGASQTTDATGVAAVGSWRLGTTAGVNTLIATAAGLAGDTVVFRATGTASAPSKMWAGGTSTDWLTASNWSPVGVPTATDDVLIPGGTPNQPVLSANGSVNSLTIQGSGASLTLSGSFAFVVNASLLVTGQGASLILDGQSVTVQGDLSIASGALLDLSKSPSSLAVSGNATFGGGDETALLTAGTLVVAGNFSQTSGSSSTSFLATGTKTILTGTSAQSLTFQTPASSQFHDLTIGNSAGTSLESRLRVGGNLSVSGSGSDVILNGHTLQVSSNFVTADGALLTMTRSVDSLVIGGDATFSGGDETGQLVNGTLEVAGNFTQNQSGLIHTFSASGAHITIFDGSVPQTMSFSGSTFSQAPPQFANIVISNPSTVTIGSGIPILVTGRLSLTSSGALQGGGGGEFPVTVTGRLSTAPGSTLSVTALTVNGDSLNVSGGYDVATTTLTGTGYHAPVLPYRTLVTEGAGLTAGALAVDSLVVNGQLMLGGTTTVRGSVFVVDTLTINGHTLTVQGNLLTAGGPLNSGRGALEVTNTLDSVVVSGGVGCACRLSAGVLLVAGGIGGTGGLAGGIQASGTNKTVLNGSSAQAVGFSSHFQDLEIANSTGSVDVQGADTVAGRLIATGSSPDTIRGAGADLIVATLDVGSLVLDHVRLKVNAPTNTPLTFDNVLFQNYAAADTQFVIVHPGGTAFTFNNLAFSTVPSTGLYVFAADSGHQIPLLTITIATSGTPSAAQGQAFTMTDGFAQVTWH